MKSLSTRFPRFFQHKLRRAVPYAATCLAAFLSGLALAAAEHEVDQKNLAFSVATLNIKVGDTVVFKNDDTVSHNIFSLSDVKPFDLGAFGKGQLKKVTFDQPGTVDVECAIHPQMKMKIIVSK